MFRKILSLVLAFLMIACQEETVSTSSNPVSTDLPTLNNDCKSNEDGWVIPISKVIDGGVGKDGIPALELPAFIRAEVASYLEAEDVVVGIKIGNTTRAYPHKLLDKHEIVNDEIEGVPFAISLCPLTGTSIGFRREILGNITTLGVSGFLYNSNLIMYDRATDTHWGQMWHLGLSGPGSCEKLDPIPVFETSWANWLEMYPNTEVLSLETGFDRNYEARPYGASLTPSSRPAYPFEPRDERLAIFQKVHGLLIDNEPTIFPFFKEESGLEVQNISLKESIVIFGDSRKGFMRSYFSKLSDGTRLSFNKVEDQLPIVMEDQEGNQWDIWGRAMSGPRLGQSLIPTDSYNGFWFAWAAMYPEVLIFGTDFLDE